MITAEHFLLAIEENPRDVVRHLVYADWLEEQGDALESKRQRDIAGMFESLPRIVHVIAPSFFEFICWCEQNRIIPSVEAKLQTRPTRICGLSESEYVVVLWNQWIELDLARDLNSELTFCRATIIRWDFRIRFVTEVSNCRARKIYW